MEPSLLHRLATAHSHARMVGWNFSYLEGRLQADEPDWAFDRMCLAEMSIADSVLDLGTGGGERYLRLRQQLDVRHRRLSATEGWPPNVIVARQALQPWGIDVREYNNEVSAVMPYPSESFDLVMARHESYDVDEVARVLRPGGLLLTQQVHGRDAQELRDWFGGQPFYPDTTLERHVKAASQANLGVEAQGDWTGHMQFSDVQTLVEYMGLVPWDVPGFTVEPHLAKLEELDDHRPIVVSQRRFWMMARKTNPRVRRVDVLATEKHRRGLVC